jgi:NAD(P)H-nitrite reductase large subunit
MLKIGGTLSVFSVGDVNAEGARLLTSRDGGYGCLTLKDDRLVGAALIGNTTAAQKLRKAVAEGRIFDPETGYHEIITAL